MTRWSLYVSLLEYTFSVDLHDYAYIVLHCLFRLRVQPKESALHGFWAWGQPGQVVDMRQTQAFAEDWIGLKSLDSQGRLHQLSFEGEHIIWPVGWWDAHIMQFLNNTL